MKKSIVALSIALLVVSLGASLALAAPQGTRSWPTGEDPTPTMMGAGTGPMMTTDQMQTQMRSQQNNGMMPNGSKDMPCQPNTIPAK
jgi:hypothetical protein